MNWKKTSESAPTKRMSVLVAHRQGVVFSGVYFPVDGKVSLFPEDFGAEPLTYFDYWMPFPAAPGMVSGR